MEKRRCVAFILRGMPGLGHVSPGFAIADRLARKGFEIHFITYENGATFLKKNGMSNVHEVHAPKHQKTAVPWKDLFEVTVEILPILKKINPGLIVVDGEFDAFFLLRRLNAKVIMLTTRPYVDYNLVKYGRYADYVESAMNNVDKILVHGIEKPGKERRNQIFVGPLARDFKSSVRREPVIPISIGFGSSLHLIKFANAFAEVLEDGGYATTIIGSGGIGAGFVREPLEYFSSAPLIVAHGGMATIEEAAILGKPIALLCDDDEEKRDNALSAERLGYGLVLDTRKRIDRQGLTDTVEKLLDMVDRIRPVHNGIDTAVEIVVGMLAE